jgi:hypothetical protein
LREVRRGDIDPLVRLQRPQRGQLRELQGCQVGDVMLREQPFLIASGPWVEVWDGNPTAAALYDRHYSRNVGSRGDPRVAGPGEKMVLLTPCARALFVWRVFRSKDPTAAAGDINCAIFRNEGAGLASDLISSAMTRAWDHWGPRRLYTYVNPRRVVSSNPGYCFKVAGWTLCGVTKTRKLLILEALP